MAQNYRCSECGNEFKTEDQLEQHNRQQHGMATREAGSQGTQRGQTTQRGQQSASESRTDRGNR